MKRSTLLSVVFTIYCITLSIGLAQAQTTTKTKLPQVPITYPGDTDETITRRAQWIEGAKKEGKLIWWFVILQPEMTAVMAEFNKVYPFIKGDLWRGEGEDVASKLEAGFIAGYTPADLTLGGEVYNYPRWRKMGLIARLTNIIPGIEKLDKRMFSTHGDTFSPGSTVITPHYNTKLVSAAEALKSWEDLLDPKWKGRIGLTTDMKPWTTLALGEGGWGIAKTEEFLGKLKGQSLIWAPGFPAAVNLNGAGEFAINAASYLRYIATQQPKGVPINWAKVKPVGIAAGPSIITANKSPNPNATRLFIEWLSSPTGRAIYEKITAYGPAFPGSGTVLSKLLEGSPFVVQTEDTVLKEIELGLHDRFRAVLGIPK